MSLDQLRLKEVVETDFVAKIADSFGNDGDILLIRLGKIMRKLYTHILEQDIKKRLMVFTSVRSSTFSEEYNFAPVSSIDELGRQIRIFLNANLEILIYIDPDGNLSCASTRKIDEGDLPTATLQYNWEYPVEYFVINGEKVIISNLIGDNLSIFSIPTFAPSELEDALERYKVYHVKTATCSIYAISWQQQIKRLYFVNKPEKIMRRSLTQYLRAVLGSAAEVMPEQNVDETKPVDIIVKWTMSSEEMLIEIKWLGKSLNATGNGFTEYTASRARDGAKQLADYIDRKKSETPSKNMKGILVVFDGRRAGININTTSISLEDGFYYQDSELDFNPEYHNTRDDFLKPLRLFTEPTCD